MVRRLSEHRGPASEAETLYEETPESIRDRERLKLQKKAAPKFDVQREGQAEQEGATSAATSEG